MCDPLKRWERVTMRWDDVLGTKCWDFLMKRDRMFKLHKLDLHVSRYIITSTPLQYIMRSQCIMGSQRIINAIPML